MPELSKRSTLFWGTTPWATIPVFTQ